LPKVFSAIDRAQREYFDGKPTSELSPGLPPGQLHCRDTAVRSRPIAIPNSSARVQFAGALDALAHFDDGSLGIIDFKTTSPREEHVSLYTRQLHAYALALELPDSPAGTSPRVTSMGLLCFEPVGLTRRSASQYDLETRAEFIDTVRSDGDFMAFLSEAVGLLRADRPPEPQEGCPHCKVQAGDLGRRGNLRSALAHGALVREETPPWLTEVLSWNGWGS
jgi:hypothetical protein